MRIYYLDQSAGQRNIENVGRRSRDETKSRDRSEKLARTSGVERARPFFGAKIMVA
jgi:hypothetical protein